MTRRKKKAATMKRHVQPATLEETLFNEHVCLLCGDAADGRLFGDGSPVPICKEHLRALQPVIQKFAAIQTPAQLREVHDLKDQIKRLSEHPKATQAHVERITAAISALRDQIGLARISIDDDRDSDIHE